MNLSQLALLAATQNGSAASTNLWYFLIAYIALWVLIFGYLFYLHGRVKSLENDLKNQNMDPLSGGNKVTPSDVTDIDGGEDE
jgi:CcmD family protein